MEKEQKTPLFTFKQRNVRTMLASVAEGAHAVSERINQKKMDLIKSVPVIHRMYRKAVIFDYKMTKRYGHVYTKIRDSIKNTVRTVGAAYLFGIPGVIGICAYKTGEKLNSLIKPAMAAKKAGEVDSIFDYLKTHKNESRFTLTSASLSIASAAGQATGAKSFVDAVRVGKATLLAAPEALNVAKTAARCIVGREELKELGRDAAVLGITIATYFAGNTGMPMTRGAGKPLPEKGDKDKTTPKLSTVLKVIGQKKIAAH